MPQYNFATQTWAVCISVSTMSSHSIGISISISCLPALNNYAWRHLSQSHYLRLFNAVYATYWRAETLNVSWTHPNEFLNYWGITWNIPNWNLPDACQTIWYVTDFIFMYNYPHLCYCSKSSVLKLNNTDARSVAIMYLVFSLLERYRISPGWSLCSPCGPSRKAYFNGLYIISVIHLAIKAHGINVCSNSHVEQHTRLSCTKPIRNWGINYIAIVPSNIWSPEKQ